MKWAPLLLTGLLLASASAWTRTGTGAFAQEVTEVRISKFSGKQVPRFETLKYASVNGRKGPGRDHPILWHYERKGLPLLIIKESRDWRRVRDPDGAEVWVHARMLEPTDTAMVQADVTLHREPGAESEEIARVEAGVLVQLEDCSPDWCRIKAGNYRGWVPLRTLWGTDTGEASL